MIQTPIRRRDFRTLCCGLVLALGAACSGTGAGQIPCRDTTNCPGDFPTCSAAGFCVNNAPAASIEVVSGDAQTGVVGNALAQSLVIRVLDTNGNAVPAFGVTWSVGTGAGQVSAGSTTTGPDGKASITATVGTIAGANSFTAAAAGLTGSPKTFTATGIADVATTLVLTGFPTQVIAGTPGTLTATALDKFNNTAPSYRGTVHITSDNPNPTLPIDHTFTAGDSGVHGFPVTLKAASSLSTFSITATDTVTATITASQTGITVNPDVAVTLQVVGFNNPATAGNSGFFIVAALDAFANSASGYRGTVHITSSDGAATPPPDHTYTVTEAGVHTFSMTLKTAAPSASIIATDTGTMTITGSQTGILVNPGATTKLLVTGFPNPASADTGGSVTVTAADANNNTTPAYRGTVVITTDNTNSTLPMTHAFIAADNGVFTFTGVVLKKASQPNKITATDTPNSLTGSQTGIVVNPGATAQLLVTGFPNPASADTGGSVTVTAADANGNTTPGYLGTVHFTSDNPNKALPADYTFVGGDNGAHTFAGVVLKKASPPSYSIAATDTVTASITGTQAGIVVNPGATAKLQVVGFPSPVFAGTPGSVTVTAQDANNNTTPLYAGTVQITSSDTAATDATATPLPLNYTFTVLDAGVHAFTVILNTTSGATSITATDTVTGTITGSQAAIVVNTGPLVFGATATLISGGSRVGRIFVAGGSASTNGASPFSNTWFYDPANSSLTAGPPLAFARAFHTATAIGGGQVLVAGGASGAMGFTEFELCSLDGVMPSCAASGGTVSTARCNAAAALAGASPARVLIAGGDNCVAGPALTSWDLWDGAAASTPVINDGTSTNKLTVGRRLFTATVVGVGKVLLAGGNTSTATADVFTLDSTTPANSTIPSTPVTMTGARRGHSATLLTSATTACPSGSATLPCVLVAGGNSTAGKTWEIYDASTNTFPRNAASQAPPNNDLVVTQRQFQSAAAFANGKVVLAGGNNALSQSTTEVFDLAATTLSFTAGPALRQARFTTAAAYAPLQDVLVLIGGNTVGPSTEQVTAP